MVIALEKTNKLISWAEMEATVKHLNTGKAPGKGELQEKGWRVDASGNCVIWS